MAWNRIGNLAVFSLALIFTACGGDSGSNVSNDGANTSSTWSDGNENYIPDGDLNSSNSVVLTSSSSFRILELGAKPKLSSETLDSLMSGARFTCNTLLYGVDQNTGRVVGSQDTIRCIFSLLCKGDSWSVYEQSTDKYFYCDMDALGNWSFRLIQNGDGVAIRSDGLAYKTFVDERDGNVYKMGIINNKVWMLENLKFETGEDNSCTYSIGCEKTETIKTRMGTTKKYDATCYLDEPSGHMSPCYSEKLAHGGDGIYANNPLQGICPRGWHLPDTVYRNDPFISGLVVAGVGAFWTSTYNPDENYYYAVDWTKNLIMEKQFFRSVVNKGDTIVESTYYNYKHDIQVRCVKDDIW